MVPNFIIFLNWKEWKANSEKSESFARACKQEATTWGLNRENLVRKNSWEIQCCGCRLWSPDHSVNTWGLSEWEHCLGWTGKIWSPVTLAILLDTLLSQLPWQDRGLRLDSQVLFFVNIRIFLCYKLNFDPKSVWVRPRWEVHSNLKKKAEDWSNSAFQQKNLMYRWWLAASFSKAVWSWGLVVNKGCPIRDAAVTETRP
jgi:hypothetical protein